MPAVTVTSERDTGALTVPGTAQATADIQRTPGAAQAVPDTAFKDGPAQTIKDVIGNVPGVVVQSRWGPDARVSIRGSGLSRNDGNRGISEEFMIRDFSTGYANDLDGFRFPATRILLALVERVEVVRGAAASRWRCSS